ncbi:MAG: nucleotidyl transferase AbiEii/AbiGii toxin family protein [Myxococcales bacterium]
MDFAMVLGEIVRFLSERGIRYSLAGAVALHAHGISRATQDLDIAVDESGRAALLSHLAALGYTKLHESEGFSNHHHPEAPWGRLDFIYLEGKTADLFFAGAKPAEVFHGVTLPVPRPEHLAAMKAQAIKETPSRTARDLADVAALLRLPGIDEAEMRRYFDRHGLAARFDELVRQRGPT